MNKWLAVLVMAGLVSLAISYPAHEHQSSEESSEQSDEETDVPDSGEVIVPSHPALAQEPSEEPTAPTDQTPTTQKIHPDVPSEDVCETMKIGHNGVAKNNEQSPYTMTLSAERIPIGGSVSLTISSKNDTPIKGLLVQGRCGGQPVGSFVGSSVNPTKFYDCNDGQKNAVVYIDMGEQNETKAVLDWTAPSSECPIDFYASIVKSKEEFWEKQKTTSPLLVTKS